MNCRTSSYAPRFLAVAAIAVLVALFATPAHAQILCTTMTGCNLSFVGGVLDDPTTGAISPTDWVPSVSGGVLELTQNAPNERGAAWFNTPQQVEGGFGVEFQFQVTGTGEVGDGLAFVIQNIGPSAIGGFGGGIGYGTRENDPCSGVTTAATYSVAPCAAGSDLGIPNSVAIEFDTFANSYDADSNHVAIQSCGTVSNLADHSSPCLIARTGNLGSLVNPINLSSGLHYVQIVYLPYSATCPTANPCPNLSVYIDPAGNGGEPVLQAHVDLNNPCTAAAAPSWISTTRAGCATGAILSGNTAAYVGFTAATRGAVSEHQIQNFTFSPSITKTLQGSGATNSFPFSFATYDVIYPADVPVTNTTMTITPTVLPPVDCNARIDIPAFTNPDNTMPPPTCTTFAAAGTDAAIFDVACAVGANQTQGEACPQTTGFNPSMPGSTFHSSEDINNIVLYADPIPAGIAPQFLTASEGTNGWVPIGVGFAGQVSGGDPTKGGGTNNFQSQMVLADFPLVDGTSPFAIPPYTFTGFAPPVTNQGNNVLNVAQAGQTIPLKYQLNYGTCPPTNPTCGYNGGPVTNSALAPAGYVTILAASGCSFAPGETPTGDDTIPVDSETQTGLVNQGNGNYQFGWKTLKSFANSCLTVTVDAGDGVQHNADFKFKQ